MSTIQTTGVRNHSVSFIDHNNQRLRIELGKVSSVESLEAHRRIKSLSVSQSRGERPHPTAMEWVRSAPRHVVKALSQLGLLDLVGKPFEAKHDGIWSRASTVGSNAERMRRRSRDKRIVAKLQKSQLVEEQEKPRRYRHATFRDHNGERQSITLGRIRSCDAKRACKHISSLVVAKAQGVPPFPEAVEWALSAEPNVTVALYRIGLLEPPKETICDESTFPRQDESVYLIRREGVADRFVLIKDREAQQC